MVCIPYAALKHNILNFGTFLNFALDHIAEALRFVAMQFEVMTGSVCANCDIFGSSGTEVMMNICINLSKIIDKN